MHGLGGTPLKRGRLSRETLLVYGPQYFDPYTTVAVKQVRSSLTGEEEKRVGEAQRKKVYCRPMKKKGLALWP